MKTLVLFASLIYLSLPAPALIAAQPNGGDVLREWSVEWGGRVRDPHVAPDGKVWFVGQRGNYIASFDPSMGGFRQFEIEEGTNPHNLVVDEDGIVWYAGNGTAASAGWIPRRGRSRRS